MKSESSFFIHNPEQIISHLYLLVKRKCLLAAHFGNNEEFFLTTIIEIDKKNNTIILDYGSKEHLNKRILHSQKINLSTEYSGIPVTFSGARLTKIQYKGEPAFRMPLPASIFWRERREFYRVKSPISKFTYCWLKLSNQERINLNVHDISIAGFSMLNDCNEYFNRLIPATRFEQCKLILSETSEDTVSFEICGTTIINPEKSNKIERISCKFTQITPTFETTIQRHIQHIEIENKQKGVAVQR